MFITRYSHSGLLGQYKSSNNRLSKIGNWGDDIHTAMEKNTILRASFGGLGTSMGDFESTVRKGIFNMFTFTPKIMICSDNH